MTAWLTDDRRREFSDWVHSSEPDVLTYAIFTRPKAKDEIMVFVRYANGAAMKAHDEAPEHQNIGQVHRKRVLDISVV